MYFFGGQLFVYSALYVRFERTDDSDAYRPKMMLRMRKISDSVMKRIGRNMEYPIPKNQPKLSINPLTLFTFVRKETPYLFGYVAILSDLSKAKIRRRTFLS